MSFHSVQGYSNISQKLMRSLGWTPGKGIGKNSQGISDPVPGDAGQSDRSGLGLRPKPKGRRKQNDILALWTADRIRYGRIQGMGLHVHKPNIKKRAHQPLAPVRPCSLILPSHQAWERGGHHPAGLALPRSINLLDPFGRPPGATLTGRLVQGTSRPSPLALPLPHSP